MSRLTELTRLSEKPWNAYSETLPERWWFSSRSMTVLALGKDGVIWGGAPIIKRFRGQPFGNLERWMRRQGGFLKAPLPR